MSILQRLQDVGAIRFGDFTFKSGIKSSNYCDFRVAASHPELLRDICYEMAKLIEDDDLALAGVPLGGIPYAVMISQYSNLPMVMVRDKRKDYGRQNMIEGDDHGRDYLIVEDVITTGGSVLDTIKKLEDEGKKVRGVIAILDREKGGVETIVNKGYSVRTLYQLSEVIEHKPNLI